MPRGDRWGRRAAALLLHLVAWPAFAEGSGDDQAPAADRDATALEPIEVTGTRIRSVDYETSQPIIHFSRADLDRTGQTSIGDFLQDLSIATQASNTAVNGGTGQTEISLRHLGSNRVLVLVNGRRWVNGLDPLSSSSVDLNTIPMSIVESIDVLKDGASAVYGTDAVSGVVNIITRKDFAGSELRAQSGFYVQPGDGRNDSLGFSWGRSLGRTSTFVDLSYTGQQQVLARDRAATRERIFGAGAGRAGLGTPQGLFIFIAGPTVTQPCNKGTAPGSGTVNGDNAGDFLKGTAVGQAICLLTVIPGTDGSKSAAGYTDQMDFRNYGSTDFPDDRAITYLQTPSDRSALFGVLSHEFGDGISFQGEFLYNLRRSQQLIGTPPLLFGDLIGDPNLVITQTYASATNKYNPFGQDIGRAAQDPGNTGVPGVGSALVIRTVPEAGTLLERQRVDTWRVGGGFQGALDLWRSLRWNAGLVLAGNLGRERPNGIFDDDHVRQALGPDNGCTPPCVSLNIFGGQGPDGRGSITPDMLAWILAPPPENSQRQTLQDAYAYASQDLAQLPAGPLQTAYGLELRHEAFADHPIAVKTGAIRDPIALATYGGYDVTEAYAEFKVPLLSQQPMAETLELSLAGRYSKYTSFGGDTNTKLGLRWKPTADLLLRATRSNTFRAPSVSELYLGTHYDGFGAPDPCDMPANPTVQANCSQDGAQKAVAPNASIYFSGNRDLVPEKGTNLTAGLVYSPAFLADLTLYADWYRIDLDNAILQLGSDFVLHECYYTPRPPGSPECARVHRNPTTGTLASVYSGFFNVPFTSVEGVDLALNYDLPWRDLGRFRLQSDTTYLSRARFIFATPNAEEGPVQEGVAQLDAQGQRYFQFAFPRWKAHAGLDWSRDRWQASWGLRYIHHMSESCTDEFSPNFVPTLTALGLCSDPDPVNYKNSRNTVRAVWYHDAQLGYRFSGSERDLIVGLNNVFNEQPPPAYSYPNQTFDPTSYDVPGRFLYLRISQRF